MAPTSVSQLHFGQTSVTFNSNSLSNVLFILLCELLYVAPLYDTYLCLQKKWISSCDINE